MNENNFNRKVDYSMAEKESLSLEYFKRSALEISHDQFEKIYKPLRDLSGIDSPAVMLYQNTAKMLKVDEVLGVNILDNFVILVDKEVVPDSCYPNYLKEHEGWEIYIANKEGFNMRNYEREDARLPLLERNRPTHRYSCYREFKMANADGKAEEYLKWWRDFYKQDLERVENLSEAELLKIAPAYRTDMPTREAIKELIQKNQSIKEWAYNKVLENPTQEESFDKLNEAA